MLNNFNITVIISSLQYRAPTFLYEIKFPIDKNKVPPFFFTCWISCCTQKTQPLRAQWHLQNILGEIQSFLYFKSSHHINTDFATGLSRSCEYTALTNIKLLDLNVTSVWAVHHTLLHNWRQTMDLLAHKNVTTFIEVKSVAIAMSTWVFQGLYKKKALQIFNAAPYQISFLYIWL